MNEESLIQEIQEILGIKDHLKNGIHKDATRELAEIYSAIRFRTMVRQLRRLVRDDLKGVKV